MTLPVTFHITEGGNAPSWIEFRKYYEDNIIEGNNMWILKPGENANRGYKI